MPKSELSDAERLSLHASGVIAELADRERAQTGCTYSEACERVLAREAHLRAAYAGDEQRFAELAAELRSTRFATPASGAYERQFRRGSPPRTLRRRLIRDRSDALPHETVCLALGPPSAGGGLYAEVLA